VRNNILLNLHPFRGSIDISASSLPGFTSDYNAVMNRLTSNGGSSIQTLAQWRTSTGQDTQSLVATASQFFVNPASDFHLLSTAPAVNAGTASFAPMIDLDGSTRPYGAAFDIGAYEWRPGAAPGDFNNDGIIDTADFVTWQKTGGAPSGYQDWRENFGESPGSGNASPAPEPQAFVAILLALSVAISLREINSAREPSDRHYSSSADSSNHCSSSSARSLVSFAKCLCSA
jgi:hypothetical protein